MSIHLHRVLESVYRPRMRSWGNFPWFIRALTCSAVEMLMCKCGEDCLENPGAKGANIVSDYSFLAKKYVTISSICGVHGKIITVHNDKP